MTVIAQRINQERWSWGLNFRALREGFLHVGLGPAGWFVVNWWLDDPPPWFCSDLKPIKPEGE